MSFNANISNFGSLSSHSRSHNYSSNLGTAVTDAVHERFRPNLVYCDNCKKKFIGNSISIHEHFNKSHPAVVCCIYCSGKVFYYYKGDINKSEKFYYHRCRDWLNREAIIK